MVCRVRSKWRDFVHCSPTADEAAAEKAEAMEDATTVAAVSICSVTSAVASDNISSASTTPLKTLRLCDGLAADPHPVSTVTMANVGLKKLAQKFKPLLKNSNFSRSTKP